MPVRPDTHLHGVLVREHALGEAGHQRRPHSERYQWQGVPPDVGECYDVPVSLPDHKGVDLFTLRSRQDPRTFCSVQCRKRRLYVPEKDVVRYCEACGKWYHVECVQRRETVEDLRAHPRAGTPDWITWDAEADGGIPMLVVLTSLVASPIQRHYPCIQTGTPLSLELFLIQLRREVRRQSWTLPRTEAELGALLWGLVGQCVLDGWPKGAYFAMAAVRTISLIPLDQRYLYECPVDPLHLM